MNVNAKCTVKVGGKYRIPNTPSATFDTKEAKLSDADTKRLIECGVLEPTTGDTPKAAKESKGDPDRIPANFPGAEALAKAGITTFSALDGVEDLTAIDGIGEATAEKIEDALEAREAE